MPSNFTGTTGTKGGHLLFCRTCLIIPYDKISYHGTSVALSVTDKSIGNHGQRLAIPRWCLSPLLILRYARVFPPARQRKTEHSTENPAQHALIGYVLWFSHSPKSKYICFVFIASCIVIFSEIHDRKYSQFLDVPLVVYSGCWG